MWRFTVVDSLSPPDTGEATPLGLALEHALGSVQRKQELLQDGGEPWRGRDKVLGAGGDHPLGAEPHGEGSEPPRARERSTSSANSRHDGEQHFGTLTPPDHTYRVHPNDRCDSVSACVGPRPSAWRPCQP
jgi:hypothetical protein